MHWAADDQAHGLADGMPESLRSLISRRLTAVPDEQRQILETAGTGAVTLIQLGVRIINRGLSPITVPVPYYAITRVLLRVDQRQLSLRRAEIGSVVAFGETAHDLGE